MNICSYFKDKQMINVSSDLNQNSAHRKKYEFNMKQKKNNVNREQVKYLNFSQL